MKLLPNEFFDTSFLKERNLTNKAWMLFKDDKDDKDALHVYNSVVNDCSYRPEFDKSSFQIIQK